MFQLRHLPTALAIVFGTLCFGVGAEAQTYYASPSGDDGSAGTLAQPFRTIQKGLSMLHAGDVLYLRAGTYQEQLLEVEFGSGGSSWNEPVTVAAYPSETVILRPVTNQGNVVRFQDGSVSFVRLAGLILDAATAGGGSGASVVYCGATSHDLHLDGVEMMNGNGNGSLCTGKYIEFRNMRVHDNGGPAYPNANGMYMTGSYITIIGGEFYDNVCYGVRFWDSAHPATMATHNIVAGARIYRNGLGIARSGTSTCPSGGGGLTIGDSSNTAANNLVYDNFWGFDDSYAKGSGNAYYNNTFTNNLHGVNLTGSSNVFRNNITYANRDSDLNNTGSGNTLDHNLANDPGFVDAASRDFRIGADSRAIDAGTTVPEVTTDFLGTVRPVGAAFDIGAFERTLAPPRNVRVSQ